MGQHGVCRRRDGVTIRPAGQVIGAIEGISAADAAWFPVRGHHGRQRFMRSNRVYEAWRVRHDVLAQSHGLGGRPWLQRSAHARQARAAQELKPTPYCGQQGGGPPAQANAPNQKKVAEFICIWTAGGWLPLSFGKGVPRQSISLVLHTHAPVCCTLAKATRSCDERVA